MRHLVTGSIELEGDYVHWDKLRHLIPPGGLTHEEWWLAIKTARRPLSRSLPLEDPEGAPFSYALSDGVLRKLHLVDQRCGGEVAMSEVVTAEDQAKQHYLVDSLVEEAIRSSQLEGATTSRAAAKEMIRFGRPPRDRSEKMILNNFRALRFIRDQMDQKLEPGLVLELQRILTADTLEDPGSAGRLQVPSEPRVAVFDRQDRDLPVHLPPPAHQLPERLESMCAFANGEGEEPGFTHPVVRSVLLHFWLAYDHPFIDGNGRTARALFYWSMGRSGYWLTEYLSISKILREAPAQYMRSFLLTETDERDTTYFILYQLEVIERAVDQLHRYLRRKIEEVRETEKALRGAAGFNHRQLSLLSEAIRDPGRRYTFSSHAGSYNVTHETARHDLLPLHTMGLLRRERISKRHVFTPVDDLLSKLRSLGESQS
jgi:Fic family protein